MSCRGDASKTCLMPKHPFLWPGHASQSGPRMHLTPNPRIHRSVRTQARGQSPDVFPCLVVRDLGDAGQTSTSRFLLNGHNTSAVNTTVRLCWLVFNGLPVLACRVYRLSLRRWTGRGGPAGTGSRNAPKLLPCQDRWVPEVVQSDPPFLLSCPPCTPDWFHCACA